MQSNSKERNESIMEKRNSYKKDKNTSLVTCESLAKNLFCEKMLNKSYVTTTTLRDALGAKNRNAVTRMIQNLGLGVAPYKDTKTIEEKTDWLYKHLKIFQMEGLKAYLREIRTREGKEKAKERLKRKKFPEGYKTKKKKQNAEKEREIREIQTKASQNFDKLEG